MGKKTECTLAKKCSACQLSNMDYDRQLKFKQAAVVKLLKRYGKVNDIIGMDDPWHYRSKAQYSVKRAASNKKIVTGVYQSANTGIVVTDNCLLNDKLSNLIVKHTRKILEEQNIEPYNPKNRKGVVRHIMVRNSHTTNEYMVVIVCIDDSLTQTLQQTLTDSLTKKFPEIKTIVINISKSDKMMLGKTEKIIYGSGYIEDIICQKHFRLSPRSFCQVNPRQTEVLYQKAIEYAQLTGSERILDAYCGIGTIGICASDGAKSIVGAEINSEAVKDAVKNAKLNNIENAVYYAVDAAEFMEEASQCDENFDAVFADPPRAGCSRRFLTSLSKLSPKRIVYISCEAQTLARDLHFLIHNGYKVMKIQPVDMFPHTRHIETVVLLSHI